MAIERDTVLTPPEPTGACCFPEHVADREIELDSNVEAIHTSRGWRTPVSLRDVSLQTTKQW